VIREHADNPDIERIISDLEARDPVYSRINELPAGIYERERFFTRNSIDGILGYLNA